MSNQDLRSDFFVPVCLLFDNQKVSKYCVIILNCVSNDLSFTILAFKKKKILCLGIQKYSGPEVSKDLGRHFGHNCLFFFLDNQKASKHHWSMCTDLSFKTPSLEKFLLFSFQINAT